MRKIYFSVIAAIVFCMTNVAVFATGAGGNLTDKILNIIILAGFAFFAIGMLMLLLSMFVGKKKKKVDEDYYDFADEDSDDEENNYSEEDAADDSETVEESGDANAVVTEESVQEGDNSSDESEGDEVEADIEAAAADDEPAVDEEPEEAEEKANVRLTFTGMNNSDVKIVELLDSITLGRRNDNDMVVADGAVSGRHCEFTYEDDTVYITDLDSTNGTLLNDEPIVRAEVNSGDTIIVGKYKYKINITVL